MTDADGRQPPEDFDFLIGDWVVAHRRLDRRLAGCSTWTEFAGRSSTRKILGGFGNLEDNFLAFPEGAFRAIAVRSYCAASRTWSIWWLDGRHPTLMDKPVVGGFDGDTGLFFAEDEFEGRPIRMRFIWSRAEADHPTWEQAFSPDGGRTWETNWTMRFTREAKQA